jgi:two-component system phosphate regulon sensor histidine kinase PhoR
MGPLMEQPRHIPIAGVVIALTTATIMAFAGVELWLIGAMLLVWIGSFWLAAPPPAPQSTKPTTGMQLTTNGVSDLIERSGVAMVMLDENRIIIANAAAREVMGAHVLGQDARVAFRHPAAVELLSRAEGGSETVHGLTGPGSNWQISIQPIDERYSLIELLNRTAEVDISRAHTDFVANASHELRTPLASIIGYMETLVDAKTGMDPDRANRFNTTVLREARRLQALVSDLMSLSRVEAEKHDQPREQLDLIPLVQRSARDGATAERQDRLQFVMPDENLVVRGDRNQLEQLIRNLVENAFKYGSPEAPVVVSLEKGRRNTAVVTVRDQGEGIAPEHIPHLTRRFYRTDPGRSRAAGGTGLGLAIVKHIVERHRGQLDIASTLGEGTSVTVALPLAD